MLRGKVWLVSSDKAAIHVIDLKKKKKKKNLWKIGEKYIFGHKKKKQNAEKEGLDKWGAKWDCESENLKIIIIIIVI